MKKAKKATKAVAAKKKAGTAVAIRKAPQLPAPTSFDEFLNRAARDPNFNLETFKAVLDAKERQDARDAEARYNEAMARVQEALQPVRADMASATPRNKYASAVKLDAAIRPTYSKYGFAVSFDNDECPQPLTVRVVAYVTCAGHTRRHQIDVPADGKGPSGGDVMSKTHAVGSANTYGRGILLRNIFNLVVDKTTDDDGRAAGGNPPADTRMISTKQAERIRKLITETNSSTLHFLEYLGEQGISSIPASRYDEAIRMLEAKKTKMTQPQ